VIGRKSQPLLFTHTVASQEPFPARADDSLRGGQHQSVAFRQRLIKSVREHVEILGLEPCLEEGEVVEVWALLQVQMPRRHLLIEDRRG